MMNKTTNTEISTSKNITPKEIRTLLHDVKKNIAHHNEVARLKGENFNVFSILGLENNENKTHSAFISELLNPNGSHLKGNIFLKLFLQVINDNSIDLATSKVKTEHYIGKRDDACKQGGRIDIYIWDQTYNAISIENKIYAGDQDTQIERYCNHNKDKNSVYYLTLFGDLPTNISKGDLIVREDYKIISYKEHLLEWLDICIKEAAQDPILRETIKQYQILIQKITGMMDTKAEKELSDIIFKNYEEAAFVSSQYIKACNELTEGIREEIINQLKIKFEDKVSNTESDKTKLILGFKIKKGSPTQKKDYSQIWIYPKGVENKSHYFGIESFSYINKIAMNKNIFIGVFNDSKNESEYSKIKENYPLTKYWINVQYISEYKGYTINFSDPKTLKKLYSDNDFRDEMIKHIVSEVEKYLKEQTKPLITFLNN